MAQFEPADGSQARWKTLYEKLKAMAPGDILTYEVMGELLPGVDRNGLQSAMRRAAKEFQVQDNRALSAVPTVGYRIVDPMEHVQLARQYQAKSLRSLARGHDVVTKVDYNGMSPELRALTEATARSFSMQMAFNRHIDIRQRKLEETVASTVIRSEVHEDQIADLQRRLSQLESTEDPSGS